MRIRRVLIVPAILALGVASSPLTGPAMLSAAGHATSIHVPAVAITTISDTFYHT
jgi:hypothetical protein